MSYLVPLLGLALAIAFHEVGHWLMALALRLSVEEFSVGLGPKIWSWNYRGTEYALRALPLGAKVQIRGIHGEPEKRGLAPASKRFWVVSAGPLANFALTFLLLWTLYLMGTHVPVPRTIGQVFPGSEAARAMLLPGDEVQTLNGEEIGSWSHFVEFVADRPGENLTLGILRDGVSFVVGVQPKSDKHGVGRLGIAQRYTFQEHGMGEAAHRAIVHSGRLVVEEIHLIGRLLLGKPGAALNDRAAFVRQTSEAASRAGDSFIRLLAALSLGLALLHLLPFPSLDGGRLAFLALGLGDNRATRRMEALLHAGGLLFLVGLITWFVVADVAILLRR